MKLKHADNRKIVAKRNRQVEYGHLKNIYYQCFYQMSLGCRNQKGSLIHVLMEEMMNKLKTYVVYGIKEKQ